MGFLSGLSSGLGFAGALIGANGQSEANKSNQALANQMWQQNYLAQKEFAQNGIRWRVDDAKAAGLHPLFALGATGASYSPVNTSSYYENESGGLGNALSNMGQDISRAQQAKMTRVERAVQDLRDQKLFDLDVQQKEANIALTQAQTAEVSSRNQQQVPALPYASGYDISNGQGDYVNYKGDYGVLPEVLRGTQFYEMPGGGYMIAPHNQLMDLVSEGFITKTQFYAGLTDAFEKGMLKPPKPPEKGFKWVADLSTGQIIQIPKNSKKVTNTRNIFAIRAPTNF